MNAFGLLFAFLSAFANGTFVVPSKLDLIKLRNVSVFIFTLYTCLGISLTSLLPLFFVQFVFTPLGLLSGFIFTLSSTFAFFAVSILGMAVASGIWCGTAILIAFFFGEFFQKPVSNNLVASISIIILLASIIGISIAGQLDSKAGKDSKSESSIETGNLENQADNPQSSLLSPADQAQASSSSFVLGLAAAIAAGASGGLILAPETYAPATAQDLGFLPSFALGVFPSSCIVTAAIFIAQGTMPEFHILVAVPLGILSGAIWNTANVCSMFAVKLVSYSIAYPIMQCGLFVGGLWGIILFGEMGSRQALLMYLVSGAALVLGAFVLASAG